MTSWTHKTRVTVGSVSLALPSALVEKAGRAIDSSAGVFEAEGLTVIVDDGPFADRLDRVGGADYEEEVVDRAGWTGRRVSFSTPGEDTRTVGFHATAPRVLTVLARADHSVPRDVVEDIFRSLQSVDHHGDDDDVEPDPEHRP